ncbi:MAG: cupin domain-containing protein [Patescibacteria group bacterium]
MTNIPQTLQKRLQKGDTAFSSLLLKVENGKMYIGMYDESSNIPEHNHETENVGLVIEGELLLEINGITHIYKTGDWYEIPRRIFHKPNFETQTKIMEFWFD